MTQRALLDGEETTGRGASRAAWPERPMRHAMPDGRDGVPVAPLLAAGSAPQGAPLAPAEALPALSSGVPEPVAEAPAAEMSAAELLVASLVAAGVDTYFGVPGGPVSPIFDAVLRTPGARLVESRHESSAALAAVGYHRASGKVPAVLVTAGPGATNAVTGVAAAHLERVPMLVICGDVAWAAQGRRMLQDSGPEGIHVEHLFAGITRATVRVAQPRTVVTQGIAALQAARHPHRPGPALLVVPIHQARVPVAALRVEHQPWPGRMAPPRMEVIEEILRMLAQAERPLLVLGAACRAHAAAVRRLVDALDVPFVTTPQAKGVVSERHPRSLRHGGLAASQWARQYTAAGVDVAVVLGTDLDDCAIGPTPYVAPGGRLVHVDIDPAVLGRNLPADIGLVADLGDVAALLSEAAARLGVRNRRADALLRRIRRTSPFAEPDFAHDDASVIRPHRAIADLERAAPGAAFVTDIGEHMLFALHYLTARGPDAFSIGLSLGTMGSGIAGAIGMALARPERPVVCICGDGGMQMVGMEALVALRERLPVIYAVFNDARYNMVYHGFRQVFGHGAAWDTPWVDFAGWAQSMGMAGVRIERPGEISPRLIDELVAARVPAVLDIRIDRDVALQGGGRNEALQHMSMPARAANEAP